MGILDNLCRFCTQKLDFALSKNIFNAENFQMLKTATLCIPLPMSSDDRYPKFSCTECVNKLNIISEFQQNSLSASKFFEEILLAEETATPKPSANPLIKQEPEESYEIEFIDPGDIKLEVPEMSPPDHDTLLFNNPTDKLQIWKCGYCSQLFNCETTFIIHLRIHTNGKPFQCSQCKKRFPFNSNLIYHMRKKHANDRKQNKYKKIYSCSECGKNYVTRRNFDAHLIKCHANDNNYLKRLKGFHCEHCEKRFQTEEEVTEHMKQHDYSFPCTGCRKWFVCKGVNFEFKDGDKKPSKCPDCFHTTSEVSVVVEEPNGKPVENVKVETELSD